MSENVNPEEKKKEENSAAFGTQRTIGVAKSQMRSLHFSLLSILIIIVLVWLMLGVVFGIMKAPSNDMSPRVDYGDLLLYYRWDNKIDINEVVVINKNDTIYIGRVIAVGGDTVEITDDAVLKVNGNTINEPKIYYTTPRYEGCEEFPQTVPEGEYFILVDRREGGEDSRYYGTVTRKEIKGSVVTIIRRNNL
ncbi:MAG: signal peptidase I [Clostridiales bacterium]|nr:signal peptidase I [Clostridiales bacterium]